jgi:hypothetical protein
MSDYVKSSNGIVINKNTDEYKKYVQERQKSAREKSLIQRIEVLENQVKDLIGKINGSQ